MIRIIGWLEFHDGKSKIENHWFHCLLLVCVLRLVIVCAVGGLLCDVGLVTDAIGVPIIAVLYVPNESVDGSLCGYDGDIPVPDAGDILYKNV